jgi:hypothetical protein
MHWKDTIQKIRNKYSQKGNYSASFSISILMCMWAIYIFPRSVCLFCCRKICGLFLGIYKSLTDTWMWLIGRAIPFLGIYQWDFCCSVQPSMFFPGDILFVPYLWLPRRETRRRGRRSSWGPGARRGTPHRGSGAFFTRPKHGVNCFILFGFVEDIGCQVSM